jgi:hypothetical protein
MNFAGKGALSAANKKAAPAKPVRLTGTELVPGGGDYAITMPNSHCAEADRSHGPRGLEEDRRASRRSGRDGPAHRKACLANEFSPAEGLRGARCGSKLPVNPCPHGSFPVHFLPLRRAKSSSMWFGAQTGLGTGVNFNRFARAHTAFPAQPLNSETCASRFSTMEGKFVRELPLVSTLQCG